MKTHVARVTRGAVGALRLLQKGLPPTGSRWLVWMCTSCLVLAFVRAQATDPIPRLGHSDGSCASDCHAYLPLADRLNDSSLTSFFRSDLGRYLLRYVHRCCHFRHPLLSEHPSPPPRKLEDLPKTECGAPAPAAGGDIQKRGAWPWLVALGERRSSGFRAVSGGTVITQRHVLTSAHSIFLPAQYKPKHARVGDYHLLREDEEAIAQDLDILRYLHPGYDSTTNRNDVAIFILNQDIVFNDYVRPACLPFHQSDDTYTGQLLTVVGYGNSYFGGSTSPVPQAAQVPVVELRRCQTAYQGVGDGIELDDSQLCAGDDQDACVGDGGSPLNHFDTATGRYYVVGIVSFGTRTCGDPKYPTVYTRVGAFLPWITEETGVQH